MNDTLCQKSYFCPKIEFWKNLANHLIWIFAPKFDNTYSWILDSKMYQILKLLGPNSRFWPKIALNKIMKWQFLTNLGAKIQIPSSNFLDKKWTFDTLWATFKLISFEANLTSLGSSRFLLEQLKLCYLSTSIQHGWIAKLL